MILEPNTIVFYVDNLVITTNFYQDLLGIKPEEASPTFHSFKLSSGMSLALKTKHAVVPSIDKMNGNGELVFTLDNPKKVDELFAEWQAKKIHVIFPPSMVPYGYTFVGLDPDGNRLRVVSLVKSA